MIVALIAAAFLSTPTATRAIERYERYEGTAKAEVVVKDCRRHGPREVHCIAYTEVGDEDEGSVVYYKIHVSAKLERGVIRLHQISWTVRYEYGPAS